MLILPNINNMDFFPTSPSFILTFIGLRAFDKPCLVGGSDKYHSYLPLAERPLIRLGHLRVGELQTLSPKYGTRPCCLVQARIQIWIRETACLIRPTVHLVGRWAAQTCRVWVLARSRPPPYPHFNRPSGFWPCVKSCLVGGCDKYHE